MGPVRTRFWLPLTRLGAFFVAVVVAGNVVLHALRPSAADLASSPDESVDYYAKKKKRLERQFQRTLQLFLGAPAKERVGTAPPVEPVANLLCIVTPPVQAPPPRSSEGLAFLAPEPAPFVWPEPIPLLPPRPFDLPLSLAMAEETAFRAELVSDWVRRGAADPAADIGDAILKGPELLLDGIFHCTSGLSRRPITRLWDDDEQRSITAQMLDIQIGSRKERIGSEFMRQWADCEVKYLGNFGESRADTVGFENRTESADLPELLLDQRKVFWDALRRTYLSRYKVKAEEKIRDDAWYVDRWCAADYAVLPPLLAAYLYYRGLEKRFTIAGSRLTVSIEPASEWMRGNRDLPALAALEWKMKEWPLGVIVSAGLRDGRYGVDFVGIGTSLGAARRTLLQQEERR